MRTFYKEGFLLLKSSKSGPVFVAPHSTLSLISVARGDVYSELITARLVRKLGGFGVVSTVPRKGKYGIDLFREAATMEEAVGMFRASIKKDYEAKSIFEKKYAFFARDQEEYLEKMNIYNQFWTTVETLAPKKPFFVLVHTQSTRMKNFPSILDVATLSGEWMKEEVVKQAVEKTNEKNKKLLASMQNDFGQYATQWSSILLKSGIRYRFKDFDLNKIKGSFRDNIENDIKKAAKILKKDYKELMKQLTWDGYIKILDECARAVSFQVTYQNTFNGNPGRERVGKLLKKCGGNALLIEASSFLNETNPSITVRLINDIIYFIQRSQGLMAFEKFINKKVS